MIGQASLHAARRRGAWQLVLPEVWLRQVAALLVAAAVAETALLRLTTRVGVHLPKSDAVSDGVHLASTLGALALNFASILSIAFVALLLAGIMARTRGLPARLALGLLSTGLLWGLALALAGGSANGDALFGVGMTLLVGIVGLVLPAQTGCSPRERVALALVVGAYLAYQYYALGHLFARELGATAPPPFALPALRAGEALVVVAAGGVFWAWGAQRWRQAGRAGVGLAAGAMLMIAASSLTPSSTTSILALWTTGLSFFLPLPLYLAALGLHLLTVIACLRKAEDFWTGAGLLLLLLAGYMPEATYHHLLLLLGVAFAGGAMRWAASEAERAAVS